MRPSLLAVAFLVAGCGNSNDNGIPPPGPLEPQPTVACQQTPIYFLADPGTWPLVLVSFDPNAMTFTTLGQVKCPGGLDAAGPVAVDHAGQIYALDNEACGMQRVFRIDPTTLECTPTPAAQSRSSKPAAQTPCTWAMSFAADTASPAGETLFVIQELFGVDPGNAYVLGRVDPSTSAFGIVGPLSSEAESAAESGHSVALTGNGNGELYAAVDAQISLGLGTNVFQVDPSTGETTFRWQLNDVPLQGAVNYHAFAEWGGDFYFFVQPARMQVEVFRFRPSDSSTTMVAETTGFDIAFNVGTSTCTP
jgi:hypothetical protein